VHGGLVVKKGAKEWAKTGRTLFFLEKTHQAPRAGCGARGGKPVGARARQSGKSFLRLFFKKDAFAFPEGARVFDRKCWRPP
jgi:hypothetical protein